MPQRSGLQTTGGSPAQGAAPTTPAPGRRRPSRARVVVASTLALAAGLLAAGCFNPFSPQVTRASGFSTQPPDPGSAIGVLRLYEWCWNHRDPDLYREIFTDDYQFFFAPNDSAGNVYRNRSLTREDELDIATNIFVRGTAAEPPPVSIQLTFDQNLVALPDSRRGKNARVHKEIAAQTLLRIEDPDYQVTGITRFFVVRGDSALLPQELVDKGFRRDSTRWYIEQIDDETLGSQAPQRIGSSRSARAGGAPRATLDPFPIELSWGEVRALWDESRRAAATRPAASRTTVAPGRAAFRTARGRGPTMSRGAATP